MNCGQSVVVKSPFRYDSTCKVENDGGVFASVEGDSKIGRFVKADCAFKDTKGCRGGMVCGAVHLKGSVESHGILAKVEEP